MAQQDAMEQVKEVVRQLIKYRFWISISVAALFGLIAYFVGSGPVARKAAEGDRQHQEGRDRSQELSVADHSHQGLRADRRREDPGPDQGRQRRLEDALRSPGTLADLAGHRPGAVPEMGPEMARGRRRRQGHTGPDRLHRGLQRLCRHGLQDLQAVRLRDGRRNRRRARPRKSCSAPPCFPTSMCRA